MARTPQEHRLRKAVVLSIEATCRTKAKELDAKGQVRLAGKFYRAVSEGIIRREIDPAFIYQEKKQ